MYFIDKVYINLENVQDLFDIILLIGITILINKIRLIIKTIIIYTTNTDCCKSTIFDIKMV